MAAPTSRATAGPTAAAPPAARLVLASLGVAAALTGILARPALGATPVVGGAAGPGSAAATPDTGVGGGPDSASLAARESAVVMEVARLSDRVDATQASLVSAQLAHAAADAAYWRMRHAVVGMVVQAYMDDSPVGGQPGDAPAPYVEVATSAARGLVARYRVESRRYATEEASYERALTGLRSEQASLDSQRRALDVLVAARVAAEERQRSADAAALAASDAARRTADAAWTGNADHAAATAAQQAVMARWPFGPLPAARPGGTGGAPALPPGLAPAGPVMSGVASWYGPGFDGQPTASGAIYDENAWTVASPDLPLGSFLVVSYAGRSVLLLVDDRGPYVAGRILDLSHAAAEALGFDGLATVSAQVVAPGG